MSSFSKVWFIVFSWSPFTVNYVAWHEAISLWHRCCVIETQVALIPAFSSSVLLGQVFLIFLLTMQLSGQSSTVITWSANHFVALLALWAAKSCWKRKSPFPKKQSRSVFFFPCRKTHLFKLLQKLPLYSLYISTDISQIPESTSRDNPLEVVLIFGGCAPFPNTVFPPGQLSI